MKIEQQQKKSYAAPRLKIHGDLKTITQGFGDRGRADFNFFGDADPYGNCRNNSCRTGS